MVSCQSWLHSCAFCCHLLLSSFVAILVVLGLLSFGLSSLSFLLMSLGGLLLIPHFCSFFFFFIVAFIRSSLSREKSDWKRVAVSSSGSSVAAVTSKVTYVLLSCSFNIFISFSCCNPGLVFWKRDRLVVVCASIIWFGMIALALVLGLFACLLVSLLFCGGVGGDVLVLVIC